MLTRILFGLFDVFTQLWDVVWNLLRPRRNRRQVYLERGEVEISAIIAKALHAQTEVILPDRARIDILTDSEAIEVDWAHKWAEGIGQALYYGAVTRKTPVVLLLMDTADEERYLARVRHVISTYSNTKLKLWLFNLHNGELNMGKKGVYHIP